MRSTRRQRAVVLAVAALAFSAALVPVAPAATPRLASPAVPGALLVTVSSPGAQPSLGVAATWLSPYVARVRIPRGQEAAAAERLRRVPGVRAVESDTMLWPARTPDDPFFDKQWAHAQTGIVEAWDEQVGDPTVEIAIIDTGVRGDHPELRPNIVAQVDVSTGTLAGPPQVGVDNDSCGRGHGTWVAGVAAAAGANATDIAGAAWTAAIVDIAVNSTRTGAFCDAIPLSAVIAGIDYASTRQPPADVINLSLGGFQDSCPVALQTAIDRATDAGAVVVAAAGNGETDPSTAGRTSVPAACANVLAVGATGRTEQRAAYSTTNAFVDLAAPGGDFEVGGLDGLVLTTNHTLEVGTLRRVQGTSFAAPYVAGVAALLRAEDPALSPAAIGDLLARTAKDLGAPGRDVEYGAGLVQPAAALRAVVAPVSASPTPTATRSPSPSPSPTRTSSPSPSPSPTRTSSPSPSPSPTRTTSPPPTNGGGGGGGGSGGGGTAPPPSPTPTPSATSSPSASPAPRQSPTPSPSRSPRPPEDSVQPPPMDPGVARVSAGSGATSAIPQAVAVSQTMFADDSAAHVVLARQDDFADALAGSTLAFGAGPLLYADATGPLPAATRAELERVLPAGHIVYLLGGPAALSSGLDAELRALGYEPVRLAGPTREATAATVAREVRRRLPELGAQLPSEVLLATRGNWPDAVSAGALGAMFGIPILLTPPTELHPETADVLTDLKPRVVFVVGGTGVVSDEVAAAAAERASGRAVRLAGPTRDTTAIAIGAEIDRRFESLAETEPRYAVATNLRRPDGYAHVLSASVIAGVESAVFVPVEGDDGTVLSPAAESFVGEHLGGPRIVGLLAGGPDLISDAVGARLEELLREARAQP
jgi:subtilisin family serine protease/putative cell wall-binding protein